MQKRGQAQVDWIISLGLFVMYLVFFFAFAKPLVSQPTTMDPLLKVVDDQIKKNASWEMQTVPLVIFSNISSDSEPIIATFPFNWNSSSFALTDNETFYLDEGRLFTIRNLSAGRNYMMIAHSTENYNVKTGQQRDLFTTKDTATIGKGLKVGFRDSSLQNIAYKDKYRLQGMNITVNQGDITTDNFTYTSTKLLSKYELQLAAFNHTTYIVADNTRIYNFIRQNNQYNGPQNFSFSAIISNSTAYYTDAGFGYVDLNFSCTDFYTSYIDLYDADGGITFLFPDKANTSICGLNTTLRFTASFFLKQENRYDIILHTGDYNSTLAYKSPYTARFGSVEKNKGLSSRLIGRINSTRYDSLKRAWSYPLNREFSYVILNGSNTPIFDYSPTVQPDSNIYVKDSRSYILDQYGNRQDVEIRVSGW